MRTRAIQLALATLALSFGVDAQAASNPPLSGAWNIQSAGSAESSGELLFRVTPGNGDDPIEVTVSVLSGSNEIAVARDIRRAFATQLRADKFNVVLGEGANVLVTDQLGRSNFSLELLDSDVDNVRVAVQSMQPTAAPTVPAQTVPATAPTPATPAGPGNAVPPTPAPPAPSSAPPAQGTSPNSPGTNPPPAPPESTPASAPPGATPPALPNPVPPPNATGGAGQPATAPPPG